MASRFPSQLLVRLLCVLWLASSFLVTACDKEETANDQDTGGLPIVDDDSAGGGDDTTADDDDADDDDTADDDTGVTLDSIGVSPAPRAVPEGTSKAFTATAQYSDGSSSTTETFVWSSSDEGILTVDQDGTATGVAAGTAVITAALGDVQGTASVIVGADVFFYDAITGLFGSYDRGTGDVTADYLDAKAAVATKPNDVVVYNGRAYIADSGDGAPGFTGGVFEGLVEVDLFAKTTAEISVDGFDNPWSVKVAGGRAYVTGNLSDELAVIDLDETDSADVYTLPVGCAPADLEVAGDKVFIACTYFDLGDFSYGDPGQVAVVDVEAKALRTIDTSQINVGNLALTPDGISLYAVATGNYVDEFGKIDRIDVDSETITNTIDMATAPGPIAIAQNGTAFVGDNFSGSVFAFDTVDDLWLRGEGDPIAIAGAFWIASIAVDPMTGSVYVSDWTNGQTVILDPDTYDELDTPATPNAGAYGFWE